jgi:glycosyltransferase involved in cell wall biosynthesis
MRVLLVSQYFWPESFSINDIARSLVDKGIELEVLTGKPNYPRGKIFSGYRAWGLQREYYDGIHVNRIPLLPRGDGGWRLALNYLSFIFSGLLFAPWLLRRKKFDVIFVYAPSPILQALPAIFIGKLKSCPVVLWVQDLWPDSLAATGHVKNNWILKSVELVVRFIYKHTDLILVPSRAFEAPVRKLEPDTPIVYQPNTIGDVFTMSAEGETPFVSGLEEGFSIMFAGNIGTAQAVNVILEAAVLLKENVDIHFIIMGDGSCREEMLESTRRQGLLNVHLPGRFPAEMMPAFMHRASALLVTLTDRPIFSMTVPNKIQAYMAAGRPIIACLNGEGAKLVVEAGAGLAAPAEDGKALAETILHLYRLSASERKKMGDNGRNYFLKHFNHEHLVDQLIRHLQAITQSGRG